MGPNEGAQAHHQLLQDQRIIEFLRSSDVRARSEDPLSLPIVTYNTPISLSIVTSQA